MASFAAKVAAEIGHAHPRPDIRKPWWIWACIQCTPGLYSAVTRAEVAFAERAIVCPYCHEKAKCSQGVMLLHHRYGEECPASGMSRATASAFIEARVNRRTVDEMLHWARFTKAETVLPHVASPLANPVLAELHRRVGRLPGQVTAREVAARVGFTRDNILSKWWSGVDGTSPRLDEVIRVADVLGVQIVLAHRLGDVVVRSQEDFHARSVEIRTRLGISSAAIGQKLRITESVANRREKDHCRVGLVRSCEWAEALGGELVVRERREGIDVQG